MDHLRNFGVSDAHLEHLFRYAKLTFDCGRYRVSADLLRVFDELSTDSEKKFWALWGKLAGEILMVTWDDAHRDLARLQQLIDKREADHLEQLQQRTWLIHWGLFIFFNAHAMHNLVDFLYSQEKILNTIQTNCPHVFRYLTVAMVITSRRNQPKDMIRLKDLVHLLHAEQESYSDPVTDFLTALYIEFDFDTVQQKLEDCKTVLANDFFLVNKTEEFLANARGLVFHCYCQIHRSIDISTLAKQMGMRDVDPEASIVELIRDAGVDAKIDSKQKQVVIGIKPQSICQLVIDKTKSLTNRTTALAAALEQKYKANAE
jgi:translation initiation factor 3 subunit E